MLVNPMFGNPMFGYSMLPQCNWLLPQCNWLLPQCKWLLPQCNWLLPQCNGLLPQCNWLFSISVCCSLFTVIATLQNTLVIVSTSICFFVMVATMQLVESSNCDFSQQINVLRLLATFYPLSVPQCTTHFFSFLYA
jgi:hypothetical protein